MKTLNELYEEIASSEELKTAFTEAAKNGTTLEFLKERGCAATEEELSAFLEERRDTELSDEDLDDAVGGCTPHIRHKTPYPLIRGKNLAGKNEPKVTHESHLFDFDTI